jgi:ribosomal protein S6--L-glutamate ligase
MKIAILSHNSKRHCQQRLIDCGRELGFDMRFMHMSYCYMHISSTEPEIFHRDNDSYEDLDAIIPRIDSSKTFYGTAVLRQFEMKNIYTLNSSLAITWSRDKLRTFQILAKKNLSLPITGFADSPEETEKLISVVGGAPLIVRLLEGTEGKGTVFAETHQAAVSVINAFKQLNTNILIQEYIQEANGVDIRCIVVGNRVITAIERNLIDSRGQTFHRKSTLETTPIKLSLQEKQMALKAAKAMKLNVATVDLIRSNRGPLVLDVDCSVHIEFMEKHTGQDIAKPILEFTAENAKRRDVELTTVSR